MRLSVIGVDKNAGEGSNKGFLGFPCSFFPKHNLLGDTVSHAPKYLSGAENHHINVLLQAQSCLVLLCIVATVVVVAGKKPPKPVLIKKCYFCHHRSLLSQLSSSIIILTFRSLRSLKQKEMSWQRRKLLHASTCSSTRFLYLLRSSISSIASTCSSFLL